MELRVNNFTNTSTLVIWKLPLTCSFMSYTNIFYKIYYQSFKPLFFITNLFFIELNQFLKIKTPFNWIKSFKYAPNSLFLPKKIKYNIKKSLSRPLILRYKSLKPKKITNNLNYTVHPIFFTNSINYYKKSFQVLLGEVYFNRNILLFEDLDQKRLFKTSHLKLPSVFKKLKTRIRRLKYTSVTNNCIKNLLFSCIKCSDNKYKFLKLISKVTRIFKKRKFFKQLISRVYNLLNTFNKSKIRKIKSPRLRLLLDKNIILNVKRRSEYRPYMFIKNQRFVTKPKITSKNNFVFQVYKYYRKFNKGRKLNTKSFYKAKRYVYSKINNYTVIQNYKSVPMLGSLKKTRVKSISYVVPFYLTLILYFSKTTLTSHLTPNYLILRKNQKKKLYFKNVRKLNKQIYSYFTKHSFRRVFNYRHSFRSFYRSRKRRYLKKRLQKFKRTRGFKKLKSLRYRYRLLRLIRQRVILKNKKIISRRSRFLPEGFKRTFLLMYKQSYQGTSLRLLNTVLNKPSNRLNLLKNKQRWLFKKKKIIKRKLLVRRFFNVSFKPMNYYSSRYFNLKSLPLTLSYYLENTNSINFLMIKYLNKLKYYRIGRFRKNGTTLINTYRNSLLFKMIKFNLKSVNRFIKRKNNKYIKKLKFTIMGLSIINVLGKRIYKNNDKLVLNKKSLIKLKAKKKLNKGRKIFKKKLIKGARVDSPFRTFFVIRKIKLHRLLRLRLRRKQRSLKFSKQRPSSLVNNKLRNKTNKKSSKKILVARKNTLLPGLNLLKGNVNLCSKGNTIYLRSFRKMYNNYKSNRLWFKHYVLLPFSTHKLTSNRNKILFKLPKLLSNKRYLSWKVTNLRKKTLPHSRSGFKKSQKFDMIRTIHKLPFILPSYGFLYITNLILPELVKKKIAFSHTRYDFSFTSVRDLKKQRLARFTKAKSVFKLFFMNKLSTNGVSLLFWNNKLSDNTLIGSTIHASGHNFKFLNKYWNDVNDVKRKMFTDNVTNKKVINIKRIKFKPGYSRMWRAARTSYKQINNLNFKYQHRLTKHLLEFYRTRVWKLESFAYFKLSNTLNDSLITSDKQTNLFFIKNDWIYVNGRVCSNPSFILGVGDFLQMTVHLKYYIMYRWLLTWSIVKQNRFKQLIHARFHKKVWRADKQSTIGLPAWLLDLEVRTKDVSKHLEVDYLTLSVFVLFDPIFIDNTYLNKLTERSTLIANMYNWKYIT